MFTMESFYSVLKTSNTKQTSVSPPTDNKETRAPSASTAHLRGIQGVGVLRRRQERDVHLCGDVADGRDFVLVWTAAVQNALRGVTQLLHGVKSHSLNKCTFHLRGEKECIPRGGFPGACPLPSRASQRVSPGPHLQPFLYVPFCARLQVRGLGF